MRELPKHKTAKSALIASGFSESTAKHQAKRALTSALKNQAREILNIDTANVHLQERTSKQLMHDILGISSQELFDRLRSIALENKDVATALKILAPLVREHGVILSSEDDSKTINVPILNLSFGQSMAKNIEPIKDNEVIESKEIKDIEDKP